MTDRHQIRTRLSASSRSFGAGLIALVLAFGAGCSNNKAADDLARLTGERDALREAIARDRAALQNVPDEPIATAAPENVPDYVPPRDDGDFGPGTTTRRDHGDLVVEVAGDVLFDSGSITLKSSAKRTLDQVARRINNDYAGNTVRVEGHTDTDPIKKTKSKYQDNEELSAQRALAVERYLVSKGVSSRRIYAAAFGPSKPKGTKAASRRVEIVILNVP